jgi:hypothetical protein
MGQPRHRRVEGAQPGCGACHGPVRPLPLGLQAQMGPARLDGRLQGPACADGVPARPRALGGPVAPEARGWRRPWGARTRPQRMGRTGWPRRAHTAVPLLTSSARRRPWSQRTRTRCQGGWASVRTCASGGTRPPCTRGRPVGPELRAGADASTPASLRSGAPTRTPQRAHAPPRAWTRSVGSPMLGIAPPGNPQRTHRMTWRAQGCPVCCRRPRRCLTAGVGAGTRTTGSAPARGVQGGVRPHVHTNQRPPLGAPDRGVLDASGSREGPRVVRPRPQRRANGSSRIHGRAPPAATKVRINSTSRHQLNSHADHGARFST